VRFFRHVTQRCTKAHQIVPHIVALEEYPALIGLQQPGDDLDGSRLARPVGSQVANHLARVNPKTNVGDRRYTAIAFGNILELKHGKRTWIAIPYVAYYFYLVNSML